MRKKEGEREELMALNIYHAKRALHKIDMPTLTHTHSHGIISSYNRIYDGFRRKILKTLR